MPYVWECTACGWRTSTTPDGVGHRSRTPDGGTVYQMDRERWQHRRTCEPDHNRQGWQVIGWVR